MIETDKDRQTDRQADRGIERRRCKTDDMESMVEKDRQERREEGCYGGGSREGEEGKERERERG